MSFLRKKKKKKSKKDKKNKGGSEKEISIDGKDVRQIVLPSVGDPNIRQVLNLEDLGDQGVRVRIVTTQDQFGPQPHVQSPPPNLPSSQHQEEAKYVYVQTDQGLQRRLVRFVGSPSNQGQPPPSEMISSPPPHSFGQPMSPPQPNPNLGASPNRPRKTNAELEKELMEKALQASRKEAERIAKQKKVEEEMLRKALADSLRDGGPRRNNNQDDDNLRLALEESKRLAELERQKRAAQENDLLRRTLEESKRFEEEQRRRESEIMVDKYNYLKSQNQKKKEKDNSGPVLFESQDKKLREKHLPPLPSEDHESTDSGEDEDEGKVETLFEMKVEGGSGSGSGAGEASFGEIETLFSNKSDSFGNYRNNDSLEYMDDDGGEEFFETLFQAEEKKRIKAKEVKDFVPKKKKKKKKKKKWKNPNKLRPLEKLLPQEDEKFSSDEEEGEKTVLFVKTDF